MSCTSSEPAASHSVAAARRFSRIWESPLRARRARLAEICFPTTPRHCGSSGRSASWPHNSGNLDKYHHLGHGGRLPQNSGLPRWPATANSSKPKRQITSSLHGCCSRSALYLQGLDMYVRCMLHAPCCSQQGESTAPRPQAPSTGTCRRSACRRPSPQASPSRRRRRA